jgi:hypothetical protein
MRQSNEPSGRSSRTPRLSDVSQGFVKRFCVDSNIDPKNPHLIFDANASLL